MNTKITEAELTPIKAKFRVIYDDLVGAGLHSSKGVPAVKKLMAYVRKRIGVAEDADPTTITAAQWADWFRRTDELRFDFKGLARYINTLSPYVPPVIAAPVSTPVPVQPVAVTADYMQHDCSICPNCGLCHLCKPYFTPADLTLLHDGGVSPARDTRPVQRYWREKG